MIEHSDNPQTEPAVHPAPCWLAGVRYPNGTEIWCASYGGEPAWTPDRRRALAYPSEGCAEMAASLLADGDAIPFWAHQTT